MKSDLILIGGGGHCRACIDVIECAGEYRISGIVDKARKLHQKVLGYEIIATDEDLPVLVKEYSYFLVTIGQIKTPRQRIKLFNTIKKLGASSPVVISPFAYVSRHALINKGTFIMHHALVNAGVQIGQNCIINSKALIEHDAIIGDHCHIATGAIVNGGVKVHQGSFIGSDAVIRQAINIGRNSVVSAGVRVMKDIPGV